MYNNLQKEYENNEKKKIYLTKTKNNHNNESDEQNIKICNPLETINKINSELKLIENDLNYYNNNLDKFKGTYTINEAIKELNICKESISLVEKSKSFIIVKELISKKIPLENKGINVLNSSLHDKLNDHLKNKLSIINKLRDFKHFNLSDANFVLYLTPDNKKIKLFSKMAEIKKSLEDLQLKIGNWDMV